MPRRAEEPLPLSTQEAFNLLTVDALKPLARLLTNDVPTRKAELAGLVAGRLRRPEEVRALYEQLEPLAQRAVQEAAYDPRGWLHQSRFVARYSEMPAFHESNPEEERWYSSYYRRDRPTRLRLFFPHYNYLPTDLKDLLLTFVPRPPEFTIPTSAEPPATVTQTRTTWTRKGQIEESEDVPVRVRDTAREAPHDLRAVLRLVEAGRVRVTDKKRQPTAASIQAVGGVLQGGDYYGPEDQGEYRHDPSHDLAIKAFAWPMILQAGSLAYRSGDKLELTPAGRQALSRPAHEVIRAAWKKWQGNSLLDEYSRIEAIKGQGKAQLSALTARRKAVIEGLAACPAGAWFQVDEFFRFLRATDRDFVLAHRPHELYIAEHYYGNLGYEAHYHWELLQGRYILAVFFEYAATMGLIDVTYLPPQRARKDFKDRWGADDYSCLSRYDGLLSVRINPLGAWCLGLAERYEPPARQAADLLQVLPNLEVVAKNPPLPASDRLLLDRFAEQQSEAVWKLTPARALAVLEEGGSLEELEEFLTARSATPLPQTAEVFLDDLRRRAGRLRDRGLARLIECADAETARMLAGDPQLREKCWLAGERFLVFRSGEESAVRRALRRLGYLLPPQKD